MAPVGYWRTAPVELSPHAVRMAKSRVYDEIHQNEEREFQAKA